MGIWFKNTSSQTVAWVANRETPLIDTSGTVKLDSQGNLTLVNGSGKVIWSSNSSASGTDINLVAKLLDTGNCWESSKVAADVCDLLESVFMMV
ncbi:putative non-specific serine/threonine protein kinase [Helianthus debilis subsp. tardiflorus]